MRPLLKEALEFRLLSPIQNTTKTYNFPFLFQWHCSRAHEFEIFPSPWNVNVWSDDIPVRTCQIDRNSYNLVLRGSTGE